MCYLLWMSLSIFVQDDNQAEPIVKARASAVIEETDRIAAELEEAIAALEQQYSGAKKGRIGRVSKTEARGTGSGRIKKWTYNFASKEDKNEAVEKLANNIREAKERLKGLERMEEIVFPALVLPTKLGEFGRLGGAVRQVIGESEMLIEYQYHVPLVWGQPAPEVKSTTLLVKGVSTTGRVDNQGFMSDEVFEIVATETYSTANGGTKTVFVAKPIDTTPIVKLVKLMQQDKKDKKK